MLFVVSIFLPSRFFRIIPQFVLIYSFGILPLLGGQTSSLLKRHGDPGCERTASQKPSLSEIRGGKKSRKKMQLQTSATNKVLGTNADTQAHMGF